jgi:serine/threonine-protein kinase
MSRAQFVERLNRTGLLPADDVAALQQLPQEDGPTLAAELVRQNKLTPFQAQAIAADQPTKLVFGEYTVLEKVGEGGMGVVYKAQHRRLKRTVALKVLHPNITKNEDAVRRFHREVEASARLSHANIVSAYDANQDAAGADGIHYLVMEFVEGTDLFHLVREHGTLSADVALEYILQAARGLEHAHARGVVHRDIKPSNLLLDREGTIKILDMGLVRLIDPSKADDDSTGSGQLTQTGEILGSFDYMAPEQAIDTKRVDHRADIYSLGCTLFYLLCGRPPYRGETSMQKLLAHRESAIPSLRNIGSAIQPDIPLALEAVFHRMMAKKPDDRYPSMLELIRDLEACRQARVTKVTAEDAANAAVEKSYRLVPSHLIVCGTLCILAVIGGQYFLAYQAAAQQWSFSEELRFVRWFVLLTSASLFAGIGMVGIGIVMSIVGSMGERFAGVGGDRSVSRYRGVRSPGRMARAAGRWLLGVLAGALVGALVGAGVGVGLATHDRTEVRILGGIVVGAFVGTALFGWRSWALILGCAVAGFFVGSTVTSEHSLSLRKIGVDFTIASPDLALIGFGIVGLVVGVSLGSRLVGSGRLKAGDSRSDRTPALVGAAVQAGEDPALASNETVRRVPKRS